MVVRPRKSENLRPSGRRVCQDPSTFGEGPIYFNDCATFEDTGAVGVTHIQVMFAPVGGAGTPRQAPMPVDVRYKAHPTAPGSTLAACRDHAYANGAGGLWLAAWVSEVDFADGTSWHAPSGAPLYAAISAAIPLKPLGQP